MELLYFFYRQILNNLCCPIALFFFGAFFPYRERYRNHKLAVHLVSFGVTLGLTLLRGIEVLNATPLPFYTITFLYLGFQLVVLFVVFEGNAALKVLIYSVNKLLEITLISMSATLLVRLFPNMGDYFRSDGFMDITLANLVSCAFLIVASVLFVLIIRLIHKLLSQYSGRLFYVLIPLTQFALVMVFLGYLGAKNELWMSNVYVVIAMIVVFIACLGDLALFITLNRLEKNAELEKQVKLNEVQGQYYELLEAQQRQVREMQHDINNHLLTIRTLIDEKGKTDNVSDYAQDLGNTYDLLRLDYCNNRALNALLVSKALVCEQAKIEQKFDVAYASNIPLSDIDLVSLFSNLLDNAIAAATGAPGAFVRLYTSAKDGSVTIVCENSISGGLENPKAAQGKMSRGNGTKIIRRIAAKCSGSFAGVADGDTYRVVIMLKGCEAKSAEAEAGK